MAFISIPILVFFVGISLRVANANSTTISEFFQAKWGPQNIQVLDGGRTANIKLTNHSGCLLESKNLLTGGYVLTQIKLVHGDSAGVVTSFYLKSEGDDWDEIDMEFLGNRSGHPYVIHTNIYENGVGGREQQFYMWFDPTTDFHAYSILWNSRHIVFYVDGVPIRVHKKVGNKRRKGMHLIASIWNGEEWATRGGLDKIKWNAGPFVASFTNFEMQGCAISPSSSVKKREKCFTAGKWWNEGDGGRGWSLKGQHRKLYWWVQRNLKIYDFCNDKRRYPHRPLECASPS